MSVTNGRSFFTLSSSPGSTTSQSSRISLMSGSYCSLSKRMMPSHRRFPQGVRNSSWTTCGCKMFPATGRDSSLSSAIFSPTNPRERRSTARLSTDPARRSCRRDALRDQGSFSEGKLSIMNVITVPLHMISAQQLWTVRPYRSDSDRARSLASHSHSVVLVCFLWMLPYLQLPPGGSYDRSESLLTFF